MSTSLRIINERQPNDPRPDRSKCRWCKRMIEREPDSQDWTSSKLASVAGRNRECPDAPNPDDGPMPGHEPDGFVIHPPAE